MNTTRIHLDNISIKQKIQLAYTIGCEVTKNGKYYTIKGADDCIDNRFRNIDEILKLSRKELLQNGFSVI